MTTSNASPSSEGSGQMPDIDDPANAGLPAEDEFHEIAVKAHEKPGEANKLMLAGYFKLSTALGGLLHGLSPPTNATFPTFATWTTETLRADVGASQGRPPLGPYALVRPGRLLYRGVAQVVLGDDNVVARNLARGEAAIYEEIGLAIRTLVRTVRKALDQLGDHPLPPGDKTDRWWRRVWTEQCDPRLVDRFRVLDDQRQASEQPEPVGPVNRSVLEEAVLPYFEVLADGLTRLETDPAGSKKRAELILLGTIRLEAYAQTRLQPVLKRNLSYLPDALRAIVGARLTGRTNRPTVALRRAYALSRRATKLFDEAFEIAATRYVFAARLGHEVLGLGHDLPLAPPANPVLRDRQPKADQERYTLGSFFPHELQTLREPRVWAAWQQFDRSTGEGSRTAVDDWLRYEERLNFIVNMFRSRQQVSALYSPPDSLSPAVPLRPASLASALPDVSDATKERLTSEVGKTV
jgi:hypothetical protein